MRARLAAITGLAFRLVKSPDGNRPTKLNMLVRQEAIRAAEQSGLKIAEDDAMVMSLTLEMSEVEGLVGFVMSAELQEKRDADSEPVTIWEHKGVVATVSPRLLRRPTLPTPLKTGVGDFFDQFVRDHRQAQAERDKNKPSQPGP
jgi:hypothetical protein